MVKDNILSAKVDDECVKKLDFICSKMGMKRSDAIRDALKIWLTDKLFTIKLKGWLFEEYSNNGSNSLADGRNGKG